MRGSSTGSPATFNYGSLVSGNVMAGGDWNISRIDLDSSPEFRQHRQNIYTRMSYDVTDNVNAYFELGWAYTKSRVIAGVPFFHLGNVTVKADNPYIPATVRAQMTALKLTSFALGTTNAEAVEFAKIFEANGADYLQVSAYGYGAFALCALPELVTYPEVPPEVKEFADRIPHGALVPETHAIKQAIKIPVSAVGYLDPEAAEKVLKEGKADFICFGRRARKIRDCRRPLE